MRRSSPSPSRSTLSSLGASLVLIRLASASTVQLGQYLQAAGGVLHGQQQFKLDGSQRAAVLNNQVPLHPLSARRRQGLQYSRRSAQRLVPPITAKSGSFNVVIGRGISSALLHRAASPHQFTQSLHQSSQAPARFRQRNRRQHRWHCSWRSLISSARGAADILNLCRRTFASRRSPRLTRHTRTRRRCLTVPPPSPPLRLHHRCLRNLTSASFRKHSVLSRTAPPQSSRQSGCH